MMRQAKTLALCALLLLAGAVVWAHGFTAVLQNGEAATFHYLLDPQALAGFDPAGSMFADVVGDFLGGEPAAGEEPVAFAELAAGETRRLEGLPEGVHLVLGFFAVAGEREFPVTALIVQVGGGAPEQSYVVAAQPALASVRPGQGRLAGFAPVAATAAAQSSATGGAPEPAAGTLRFAIDNRYDDWEPIPVFLAYTSEYAPELFTLERLGGALAVLPLGSARHWAFGGTALSEVKVVSDAQAVYLYAAARTAIDPNLSIFLYLHGGPPGGGEPNRLTVELVPGQGADPGLVVLWQRGRDPAVVGELASGNFFLEARLDKGLLEPALLAAEPEVAFLDLTTAFFDRRELSYEEFYYGSVALAQIPTVDSLYTKPRP